METHTFKIADYFLSDFTEILSALKIEYTIQKLDEFYFITVECSYSLLDVINKAWDDTKALYDAQYIPATKIQGYEF